MRLRGAAAALALLAGVGALQLGGCSSPASLPTSYGVNLTIQIDSQVSSAMRGQIKTVAIQVTGSEQFQTSLDISAFNGNEARLHYVPSVPSGSLTFTAQALDAAQAPFAGGTSGAVTLIPTQAVEALIDLVPMDFRLDASLDTRVVPPDASSGETGDAAPADAPPADAPPAADAPAADVPAADVPPADVPPADVPPADRGPGDTGPGDAGPVDAGPADAGPADAGPVDAGPMFTLTLTKSGTGTGAVSSAPAGITCGADCSESFASGTMVTLTATTDPSSTFAGWSGGGCSGTGTCTLTITAATTVTANFTLNTWLLTVVPAGTGAGTITSSPAGINCGATCTATYNDSTMVALTATPGVQSLFAGWGGACSGAGACTVTMDQARSVTATFTLQSYALTVATAGNGASFGSVTSSPTGISCGSSCSDSYAAGTVVTLTASAATGAVFTGWSGGGCTGSGTCAVTVEAATSVTATFTLVTWPLGVTLAGTGTGAVDSNPAGLDCGTTCSASYNYGTLVTLTATPGAQSLFTGWSGACTGSGTCAVTMDQASNVTATFTLQSYGVTVTRAGNGAALGTVTSTPTGINCGATCSQAYPANTPVILTASVATGAVFTGWSGGGCTGTSTCSLVVSAVVNVVATFTLNQYNLTVTKNGAGTGTVAGGGISCGATCTEAVDYNSTVTLTATSGANSTFSGWSGGGCSGTSTCSVVVSAATSVTATFALAQYPLTVTPAGNGVGTVTSNPSAISCGATCSVSFTYGQMVTLTATAAASPASSLSTFTGWSGGGCSGTGTCVVTVSQATTVTPTFTLNPNFVFITSTTYTGSMGGLAGADSNCQARATAGGLAGTYRAWLSSTTSNAITRLGTASGWVRPDGKPFTNSKTDLLNGKIDYALVLDENGADANGKTVRTATNPGTGMWNGSGSCLDWTDATAANSTTTGNNSNGTFAWSSNGSGSCSGALPIYCFGIDRAATAVPAPQSAVRRAFVSAGSWIPNTGLAAADALCQSEATAATLTGTYRALLATTTASAASRYNPAGQAWARTDDVLLANSGTLFLGAATAYWDAALNVTASRAFTTPRVWAGAASVNTVGTAALTCANWSSNAMTSNGAVGISFSTQTSVAFANYSTASSINTCDNTSYNIYCLQL